MVDPDLLRERARAMRKDATDAERVVWRMINRDQLGVRFRRQHRVGNYIADFHCRSPKLIVEVDGSQHLESDYDRRRDAWFQAQGYQVLRFWNRDVLVEPDTIGEAIARRPRPELSARLPAVTDSL